MRKKSRNAIFFVGLTLEKHPADKKRQLSRQSMSNRNEEEGWDKMVCVCADRVEMYWKCVLGGYAVIL